MSESNQSDIRHEFEECANVGHMNDTAAIWAARHSDETTYDANELQALADARRILSDLRGPFAGVNAPAWEKLYSVDQHLKRRQFDVTAAALADPAQTEVAA